MKLLIDTATKHLVVALIKGEKIVDIVIKEGNNDHSKTLMVEIANLFEQHDLEPKNLESVIIGEGPGSYTGVRIGVTVAKTLCYLLDIPMYSISTLRLMASCLNERFVRVDIDARRGYVFGVVYDTFRNQEIIKAKMRKLDEMDELAKGYPAISCFNEHISLDKLKLEEVDDVHLFTPNYLREWGE